MSLVGKLVCFGLAQALGEGTERLVAVIGERCADHTQALPRALARANDRAWQALALALAGNGLLDGVARLFATADVRALRAQVQPFLERCAAHFDQAPADFRKACLAELRDARQRGLLCVAALGPEEARRAAPAFASDSGAAIDAGQRAASALADDLAPHCPNLAQLLRRPTPNGQPLLVVAFAFFLRREVETDEELARGLTFDGLRRLGADQAEGFAGLEHALGTLGDRFDEVMGQLGRIEAVAAATHGAVLDLRAELERLGGAQQNAVGELRRLVEEVMGHLARAGMTTGEVHRQHSFSIRGEDERRAVGQLLGRYRQLPEQQRRALPALLNGLGKLQIGAGDLAGARQSFDEVAQAVAEPSVRAEARFNAYRASLAAGRLDEALAAIRDAAASDPGRFAPFPLQRYQPQRILGAGGFGTAFLCHDRFFKADVVVKTLHADDIERGIDEVFREAQVLRLVDHPSVIGVLECNYADLNALARPYIVMEYFPGETLRAYLDAHGALAAADLLAIARQLAAGMREAHQHAVLHRDLKPENVLVRQDAGLWQVKIIDFGLALRRGGTETAGEHVAGPPTLQVDTVAGTFRYAPPEQLGERSAVKPGPYSDVYAFGKTCCDALFGTTEPKRRQWASIPERLAEVLEKCTEQDLAHRCKNFDEVLEALDRLDRVPAPAPARPGPVPIKRPGGARPGPLGMTFVWAPPGTFLMGSPPQERQRRGDEGQHAVTLTRGFYLAAHPVTQAQWRALMGGPGPSKFSGDDRPVESVSWEDCQQFCRRLSEQEGSAFRLPSEAEWEYACRAGSAGAFHFGAALTTAQANFDGRDGTTAVGRFPANPWGLYDLHGNVYEWCADFYGDYPEGHAGDPTGPGEGDARLLRGGSWFGPAWYCRSAYRYWADPATRSAHIGFRVVLCGERRS